MTPGVDGSPSPIECTSVVAPPGSTTTSEPSPSRPAHAVGEQPRALEHRGGCRHQHAVDRGAGAVDAFRVDDPLHEHVADRGARRLDVERVERGQHVGGSDRRTARVRQQRHDRVGRLAIARDDDRTRNAAACQCVRVVQDDVAVAAVGAAAQQHDVGRERVDLARRRPPSADRRIRRRASRRRRAPPGAPPRPSARGRARR